jgi:hypothetical protein
MPDGAPRPQVKGKAMNERFLLRRLTTAATGVALACLFATGAHADAIDGDWCRADGKHMTIRGPDIVTPGGNRIQGDYSRHSFSYVVPAGEAGAGETMSIILRGEYLAHARQGAADSPLQEWKRCSATTS